MADRPKPLNGDDVKTLIDATLKPGGSLLPSNHFRQRMRDRHFDMTDAVAVLESVKRVKAVWNDKAGAWNYDIPGRDLDGNELTIRIAPMDNRGIVLVTGF